MARPRISFVLNTRSGSANPGADDMIAAACAGKSDITLHHLEPGQDLDALLTNIFRDPVDVVVAGGGDGTVSALAAAAIKNDRLLGVLPLGTLNHFAKDLHIPLKLEDAVANLLAGHVATVDVARVNDHVFINNASLGLYPQIVRDREALQKTGQGKWLAFAKAAWAVTRRHPFLSVELDVDGKRLARRTSLVFVGNNRYRLNGVDAGTRASLRDGELCLLVTRSQSRAGLAKLAFKSLLGTLDRDRDLESFTAREIRITTRKAKIDVATDGEVRTMNTPLTFVIRPQALQVIVPSEETKS